MDGCARTESCENGESISPISTPRPLQPTRRRLHCRSGESGQLQPARQHRHLRSPLAHRIPLQTWYQILASSVQHPATSKQISLTVCRKKTLMNAPLACGAWHRGQAHTAVCCTSSRQFPTGLSASAAPPCLPSRIPTIKGEAKPKSLPSSLPVPPLRSPAVGTTRSTAGK